MREKSIQHFSNRRLIVKGYNMRASKEFKNYFSHFGDIEDIYSPGNSFAIITFSKYKQFPPVMHQLNGRTFTVERLKPYNNPEMRTRVILANGIFNDISAASIMHYFSKYGQVKDVQKQRIDLVPVSRFAYITFTKPESAERAVATPMHLIENQIIDIRKARSND